MQGINGAIQSQQAAVTQPQTDQQLRNLHRLLSLRDVNNNVSFDTILNTCSRPRDSWWGSPGFYPRCGCPPSTGLLGVSIMWPAETEVTVSLSRVWQRLQFQTIFNNVEEDTSYRNEMLPKTSGHLLQGSCYEWRSEEHYQACYWAVSPLSDNANWDGIAHNKIHRTYKDDPTGHGTRWEKERQTEKEMGR